VMRSVKRICGRLGEGQAAHHRLTSPPALKWPAAIGFEVQLPQ